MPTKHEGKLSRVVKAYKRKSPSGKTIYIESYQQKYNKPRGIRNVLKIDAVTTKSKTAWLKDSSGRFVGRANSKGETTAKGYKMAREDVTTNYREQGKYGRIYGRAISKR